MINHRYVHNLASFLLIPELSQATLKLALFVGLLLYEIIHVLFVKDKKKKVQVLWCLWPYLEMGSLIIQLVEMRLCKIRVNPDAMICVLTRRREDKKWCREKKSRVMTKVEIRVMLLWAKEHQEPPEIGKGKKRSSPRTFRGNIALPTAWFQALAARTVRE